MSQLAITPRTCLLRQTISLTAFPIYPILRSWCVSEVKSFADIFDTGEVGKESAASFDESFPIYQGRKSRTVLAASIYEIDFPLVLCSIESKTDDAI